LPAITGLVLVAIFLLAGAYSVNPYAAVIVLSLCFGFTQFTEGAFWSATTYAAGPYTSAATGVLNTGGNAAGFLAPLVGLMVDQLGWLATLASGSVFAVIGAALWLFIRVEPRFQQSRPGAPMSEPPQSSGLAGPQQALARPSGGTTLQ
jgi:ACS family glucarate transporter-like MFS transporter